MIKQKGKMIFGIMTVILLLHDAVTFHPQNPNDNLFFVQFSSSNGSLIDSKQIRDGRLAETAVSPAK